MLITLLQAPISILAQTDKTDRTRTVEGSQVEAIRARFGDKMPKEVLEKCIKDIQRAQSRFPERLKKQEGDFQKLFENMTPEEFQRYAEGLGFRAPMVGQNAYGQNPLLSALKGDNQTEIQLPQKQKLSREEIENKIEENSRRMEMEHKILDARMGRTKREENKPSKEKELQQKNYTTDRYIVKYKEEDKGQRKVNNKLKDKIKSTAQFKNKDSKKKNLELLVTNEKVNAADFMNQVKALDTAIDISHNGLSNNIWVNKSESSVNGKDDDANSYIDDINGWNFFGNSAQVYDPSNPADAAHGTHIAGVIRSVAPDATILPVVVFENGKAYNSQIIEAIEYAEKMGAKIVNASWGSTNDNPVLKEAIQKSNMLFVTAAGNDSMNIDEQPVYPTAYAGVIVFHR